MAAPSIASGISQLNLSANASWNSATVGDADGSIAASDLGVLNVAGIDPANTTQVVENANGPSTTAGDFYSAYSPSWTAVDISSANTAIIVHFAGNPGQFNRVANNSDSIKFYAFDSGGSRATNYLTWDIGGSGDPFYAGAASFYPLLLRFADATETGTLDETDVIEIGTAWEADSNGNFGVDFRINQIVFVDGEVEFADGDGTTQGTFEEYYDLLYAESGETYHSLAVEELLPVWGFGFPVRMNCVDFEDSNGTFLFLPSVTGTGFNPPTSGYYSLTVDPSTSSASIDITDYVFVYDSGTYDLTIDASSVTTGNIDFTRCSFLSTDSVSLDGSSLTMSACTFTDPTDFSMEDADLDIAINNCTNAIQWTGDLAANSVITTDSDIDITFAGTDLSDITLTLTDSNTITFTPTANGQTYDLSGLTTTGTVTLDNSTAFTMTVVLPSGTSNINADPGTITVDSPAQTFTFNSDTTSTLIRYFEDDSQTIVDSTTGTTLDYEFPDADPVDAEFLRQGYVPINRQDIVPTDGGSLDIIMDLDEAYNSANGLTITVEYDYNRATKLLTINSDQSALDVRSNLADVIRTNSGYYNTPLLLVAIPGLTRVDLTDGVTITSMATWKGAGMERFDSADPVNPVEKWFCLKSLSNISGANVYYRQTDSGSATLTSLTNNVIDEAFQYYRDDNHDGDTTDPNEYDYSGYMVIKSFLSGSKQGRVDVVVASGLSALQSNLYTIGLDNAAGGYSGSDPGISADLTLVAGSTVGGVAFSYEWVDGGTNSGTDIANQLHYNALTTPNATIPGGTGLTWWELPDMVVFNGSNVETANGFEEGTTPTTVGFYVSRGGSDHPDFARFQGDNGTYYTPAVTSNITITGLTNNGNAIRLQIHNETAKTANAWQASTAYSQGDKVLRSTGVGTENTGGLYYVATTPGTSGGSEPTFPTVVGNTVVDGTVTWTCYAIIYYDNDPAGTGYSDSYTDGEEFDTGDTYRVRYADLEDSTSFNTFETTGIVSSTGFVVAASPEADAVYAANALDGSDSSITNKFSPDYSNNEIDLDTNSDYQGKELYAYYCFELTTSQGMYSVWGAFTAIDVANYRNNTSVFSIFLDETAGFVKQTDSVRIFRDDDTRPARDPTTGGNGIEVNWRNQAFAVATGSGVTQQDKDDIIDGTHAKVIENGESFADITRIVRAGIAGESTAPSGGGAGSYTFRDAADTKARISATVDADGQRTSVTTDGT